MLTRCPDCHNELSSFTDRCPKCGYNVKSHFINKYKNKMESELKKIDDYKPPAEKEKPGLLKSLKPIIIVLVICIMFSMYVYLLAGIEALPDIFAFLLPVFILLGIPVLLTLRTYSIKVSEYDEWVKQTNDIDSYKNSQREEIQLKYSNILKDYVSPEIAAAKCEAEANEIFLKRRNKDTFLQCEKCGSINTYYLKNPETVPETEIDPDSAFVFRMRSKKLNWKCKDCGYKW